MLKVAKKRLRQEIVILIYDEQTPLDVILSRMRYKEVFGKISVRMKRHFSATSRQQPRQLFESIMCILFIYRNPRADAQSFRLIVASNRDEVLKRPATPAHYWERNKGCLGGTDMEPGKEGGTWLALSENGKVGVILNLSKEESLTEGPKKGRGMIVRNYITSQDSAESYLNKLHKENQNGQPYNHYNLVLIDLHNADVHYLCSTSTATGPLLCHDTVLGFGNSTLQFPFQKVINGKKHFQEFVQNAKMSHRNALIENLLTFLKSNERHLPDPELEQRHPTCYKELSSIFVSLNGYGTRTHSLIMVTGSNDITFVEETLMPDLSWQRQYFDWELSPENTDKC